VNRKRILAILLLSVLALTLLSVLAACDSEGPDYHTYHRVYRDLNGEWQGEDVTYDAHVDGHPVLILVLISAAVIYLAAKGFGGK